MIQKVLVFFNAIKFGLFSPTFRQCCLLQDDMLKVEFVICRRMQIIQTMSACQDVYARDHINEKSPLIPRGASVLNLNYSSISSRCLRSLCSSPPFTTTTRMSSSNLLLRVLWLFGQRVVTIRDSGIMEKYKFFGLVPCITMEVRQEVT